MPLLKLSPSFKDYLWGGHRLADEYNKKYDGDILAESWELSCHPDGPSVIANGKYKGKSLKEFISEEGWEVLGKNCKRFKDFPVLIKFIDAKDNLSIQVHPDNQYALEHEGQYGKTEMWYVMDAAEGAYLYFGFKEEISEEEFAKRIEEDTLLEVLDAVPVHKGDTFFIQSGTIHAIGKDILIAEIQQNSNVTYRVYDYGRTGRDGKKRELHTDKAIAVTNRVPSKARNSYPHIADCDYFTVDKLNLDGTVMCRLEGKVTDKSFVSILFLDGKGKISSGGETIEYQKGDSIFLTAGSGTYQIEGSCDALVTTIRHKTGLIQIKIGLDSKGAKIELADTDSTETREDTDNTGSTRSRLPVSREIKYGGDNNTKEALEEVLKEAAGTALQMLKENNIPAEQCSGVEVNLPGGTDCMEKDWADITSRIIPLPVDVYKQA